MKQWLLEHDGWVSALQLLVWATLFCATLPTLLREVRRIYDRRTGVVLMALGLAAVGLSLVVYPTFERYEALGHAGSYAHVYWGFDSPAWSVQGWKSYVTYSVLRWIYWGLGVVAPRSDLVVPLCLSGVASGASVVLAGAYAALWARRADVGLLAAAFIAFDPVHASWGASIHNLAIPNALCALCLAQALSAWRCGSAWTFAAAASSGALVVALRVEWGLLAPALGLVLLASGAAWGRSNAATTMRFWAPCLGVVTVLGAILALGGGDLTSQGGFHDPWGYVRMIARQGAFFVWYPALASVFGLASLAIAFGTARFVPEFSVRILVGPVLGFLLFHLVASTFNDYGYRSALLPSLVIAPVLAAPIALVRTAGVPRALRLVAVLSGVGVLAVLGAGVADWSERYYMTGDEFEAQCCADGDRIATSWFASGVCYVVTDDETLWNAGVAGSHFNLMDAPEAAAHWDDAHGCVIWLSDVYNARVDELTVQDRAYKLRRWYRWERRGWTLLPDGSAAEAFQMVATPPGARTPPAVWTEPGGER